VLDPALVERMLSQLPASKRREALRGLALLAEAAMASMATGSKQERSRSARAG